jgi:hypothetical protein
MLSVYNAGSWIPAFAGMTLLTLLTLPTLLTLLTLLTLPTFIKINFVLLSTTMDYSNQYCYMCMQAKELKELEKIVPKVSQIRMKKGKNDRYIMTEDEDGIFIPTDKQLHLLVDFKYEIDDPYFTFIKNSYHHMEIKSPFNLFRSFEQYALAYVMKVKHGKVWYDGTWVEESELK